MAKCSFLELTEIYYKNAGRIFSSVFLCFMQRQPGAQVTGPKFWSRPCRVLQIEEGVFLMDRPLPQSFPPIPARLA